MHFELSCLPQPANDFSAASSFLKINLPSQQQMPLCKATFNLEMTSATTHWPEFPAPSRVMRLRGAGDATADLPAAPGGNAFGGSGDAFDYDRLSSILSRLEQEEEEEEEEKANKERSPVRGNQHFDREGGRGEAQDDNERSGNGMSRRKGPTTAVFSARARPSTRAILSILATFSARNCCKRALRYLQHRTFASVCRAAADRRAGAPRPVRRREGAGRRTIIQIQGYRRLG